MAQQIVEIVKGPSLWDLLLNLGQKGLYVSFTVVGEQTENKEAKFSATIKGLGIRKKKLKSPFGDENEEDDITYNVKGEFIIGHTELDLRFEGYYHPKTRKGIININLEGALPKVA